MRKFMILFVVMVAIFGVSCNGGNDVLCSGGGNRIVYTIFIDIADDLMELSDKELRKENIQFRADIDMAGKDFKGIKLFEEGVMDGNGKKIKNLSIIANTRTKEEIGLIKILRNGTIKNLTIESGSVKGTRGPYTIAVGAFVGITTGTSTLEGLVNKADVEGMIGSLTPIGGIVGELETDGVLTIEKVQNFGNIKGNASTGGIVGVARPNSKMTIKNVGNVGTVNGRLGTAGIVGQANDTEDSSIGKFPPTLTINNVYNYGEITSSDSNYPNSHIIGKDYSGIITITSSFCLTGAATGIVNEAPKNGALEKSKEHFRKKRTFIGWDFRRVWQKGNGYPVLK